MAIDVKNLNKKFDNFELKNINIKVKPGTIVGLIGENGAGKTTLIKCILNVMNPSSGDIKIFGEDYKPHLKEDIGVVFDDSFVNESFTIKDINTLMKGIYKKWNQDEFYKYIKDANIPLKKEYKKLSTGMKKKVQIACALSRDVKLLILDEPTSGLDPVIRSEILDMFSAFVSNKEKAILLSTHITNDLEHIADDVIFISNGEIIFDKPLKEVKEKYIILELNKDEYKKFDKKKIIRVKKNRIDYQILIDKKNFKKEHQKYIKNITTLDDIMLLYIRGSLCED